MWNMLAMNSMSAITVDDPGLSVDPNFTTVMLRNIPNKYTTKMLLNVLDRRFAKQYDYVYLPVDFVNHCNVGYAFINLKSAEIRARFYRHFHNQKVKEVLPGFNSKKVLKQVCEVNKAKVQGSKENIRRIKQMSQLMTRLRDHPDWVPLQFDNNGTVIPLDLDAPVEKREPRSEKPRREHNRFSNYGNNMNAMGAMGGMGGMGAMGDMWSAMGGGMNPYAAAAALYGNGLGNGMGAGAYGMGGADQLSQQLLGWQQAQQAYNVAIASATAAAAVSAASSPSDYVSPEDWSAGFNKENSSSNWPMMPGKISQANTKSTTYSWNDGKTNSLADAYNQFALMPGYQFQ